MRTGILLLVAGCASIADISFNGEISEAIATATHWSVVW